MIDAACPICQTSLMPGQDPCPSCGAARGLGTLTRNLPAGHALQQGKFTIGHVLGEGGFGITYKGAHRDLGHPVAIKEYFPAHAQRVGTVISVPAQQQEAFVRERMSMLQEAQLLFGLRAPGIVQVHDAFQENGTVYIVMEYLKGQTLEERIQHKVRIPADEVQRLAQVLGQALEAVHAQSLLHRDIKPANVMLTPEGRVVLLDFGSARAFQAGRTGNPTRVLTPGYAAPEQFSDRARFGPYTDIFSLGATLYHALTGAPPLPAVDRLRDPPAPVTFPSGVPAALPAALQQALALRVDDRPQDTEAFLALLAPAAADATAPRSLPKAASRWPALSAGLSWTTARENARRLARPIAIAMGSLALVTSLYVTVMGPLRSAVAGWSLSALAPLSPYAVPVTFTPMPTPTAAPSPTLTPTHTPTAWAYQQRGYDKEVLGQHAAAIADYDQALRLDPNSDWTYNARGNAKAELGLYAQAIADYDQALRLDPNSDWTYFNRGNAKAELGLYAQAIADYDQSLHLADYAWTYNARGNAKKELGQYTAAIADYDQALRLAPQFAMAYVNRGDAKAVLEQYAAAIADYDQALHLDPNNVQVYVNRGDAKAVLGQHTQAIADYDQALGLDPDNAQAYNNRKWSKERLG